MGANNRWLDAVAQWVGDGRLLWRGWALVLALGLVLVWALVQGGAALSEHGAGQPPGGAPARAEGAAVLVVVPPVVSTTALTGAAVQLQDFPWGPEARKPVLLKPGATGKAAPPALRWQAQGTFLGIDGKRRLLVRFEGDKQAHQFLGAGQVLPNGWVLHAVERFEVTVIDPATNEQTQLPWADLMKVAP